MMRETNTEFAPSSTLVLTGEEDMRRVVQACVRRFHNSEIEERTQGGRQVDYVEGNVVIDRLNEAFTPLGWSLRCDRLERIEKQLAVYGEITVHFTLCGPDKSSYPMTVTKGQWGSREIKADIGSGGAKGMEFGDDLKTAGTDALKKCATLFGIANHLYRKGRLEPDPEVAIYRNELLEVAKSKNMTTQQLLDFCSGIVRKTVETAGNLSLTQAQVCLHFLRELPEIARELSGSTPKR